MQTSAKPLHLIADAFSGIAFVADSSGQLRHLSPRFYEFTGLDPDIPPADAMRNAIHPVDRSRVLARWEVSVDAGSPFRSIFRLRRRDGCSRWFWTLGRRMGEEAAQWLGVCLFMDDLGALQMVAGPEEGTIVRATGQLEPHLAFASWSTLDPRAPMEVTRDIREKLTAAATFAAASARLLEAGGSDALNKATEMLGWISEELVGAGRLIHDFGGASEGPRSSRSVLDG